MSTDENTWTQKELKFDGGTYEPEHDCKRLTGQLKRVFDLMADGEWRTLDAIAEVSGGFIQSVSARIRDLRKARFGGHIVERRRLGDPTRGVFEYRMNLSWEESNLLARA